MNKYWQTVCGGLTVAAISGFVVLGVSYPAAFLAMRELAGDIVSVIYAVLGLFTFIAFVTSAFMLFDSLLTNEDVPTTVRDQAKHLLKMLGMVAILAAVLFALWAFAETIQVISEANHPEFYEDR